MTVKYTKIGASGLTVSDLCIGTTYFGTDIDASESLRIMNHAFENGVNFFDCANAYGVGAAEETVGRFIAADRHQKVITSKVHIPMSDNANDSGSGRKHIMAQIDASLQRLNTDFIDVYMLHYYDWETPLDESLCAMDDIVRAGKARYVGLSNFSGSQLVKSLWLNDRANRRRIAIAQTRYNAFNRESEYELFPACKEFGVGVMAYSPQAGGFLLGKHRNFKASPGSHMVETHHDSAFHRNVYWNKICFDAVETIIAISERYGASLNALALQWAARSTVVNSCVVGARNVEQMRSCLAAWKEDIPATAMADYSAAADFVMLNAPCRPVRSWAEANA